MGPSLGGGEICRRGLCYSTDAKYVVAAGPSAVFVYSARTGQRVAELELADVKSVAVDITRDGRVYVALGGGDFLLWDFLAQQVVKTLETCNTIIDMVMPKDSEYAYISWRMIDGKGKVVRVNLTSWSIDPNWHFVTSEPMMLCCSANGNYLALFQDKSSSVLVISTCKEVRPIVLNARTWMRELPNVQSVSFNEDGSMLALGTAVGAIMIFREIGSLVDSGVRGEVPKPSLVHWHSLGVTFLTFGVGGTQLLSGGKEGVLVSWNTETMEPSFFPRLGGALQRIACNAVEPSLVAVGIDQNMFRIVNCASCKVERTVRGILTPPVGVTPEEATGVCQLHPETGYAVLPGSNGTLQFFDAARDKHVRMLNTVYRSDVGQTKTGKGVKRKQQRVEHRVEKLAFSSDGSVLVTACIRPTVSNCQETATDLKFWDRASGAGEPYELNTVACEPHRSGVRDLCYSPCEDVAVTTSSSEVKVWARQSSRESTSWRCRSVGSYKGEQMHGCAISSDGSVLATACESGVMLWDPVSLTRFGSLPMAGGGEGHIATRLAFVPETDYLVGCCPEAPMLIVWDLLSMSIHWASPLRADQLTTAPRKFAVVIHYMQQENGWENGGGVIGVFSPEDSTPCGLYSQPRGPASCLRFAPWGTPVYVAGRELENGKKHTHPPLFVLLASRQYTIETESGTVQRKNREEAPLMQVKQEPVSAFEAAFGPSTIPSTIPSTSQADASTSKTEAKQGAVNKSDEYLSDIAKIPSHALPPMSTMSSDFFEKLVCGTRKKRRRE